MKSIFIAGGVALLAALLLTPLLIGWLKTHNIGQQIREVGPQGHFTKAGTPTMGGVLIIISIVVPTLLCTDLRNPYVWVALFGLLGFGAIGFSRYVSPSRDRSVKRVLPLSSRTALVSD